LFQTTATLSADGAAYRIQGHKTWSTGGEHLTHLLVKLSLVDGGVGTIIVPQNTPGVRWVYSWRDALSLRASDSHDVYFDEVSVPRDNLLEHSENGKRGATNVWFPMVLSGLYLGAAIAARNTVIRYALERVPTALGKPIATLPKIQRQIGEIDMRLQAARALLLDVVRDWEGSAAQRQAIAAPMTAAKTIVTETARQVTDQALQVAGGISLTQALPLERYFRDVRAGEMQPPSGDTALELIGRAAIAAYRPYPEKTKSSTSGGS
jgi:alkylation response protein AidB-like acyl-CoA dehydrogenase